MNEDSPLKNSRKVICVFQRIVYVDLSVTYSVCLCVCVSVDTQVNVESVKEMDVWCVRLFAYALGKVYANLFILCALILYKRKLYWKNFVFFFRFLDMVIIIY